MKKEFNLESVISRDFKSSSQICVKIYHSPQFIEWGHLQDMTRGEPKTGTDGLAGSAGGLSPIHDSYPIPPWETPKP